MNSICIFAHFNKNNSLEDYVIDYLKTLRNFVDEIIFISSSDLTSEKKNLLNKIVREIIIKENKGYDFGSWKEGLIFLKNKYKNLPNEIILCNDSCYISKDLKKVMLCMRKKVDLDFWGITKNYILFRLHAQSYFIVLNSGPIRDKKLWEKINSWQHQNRKSDYIIKYEIGLSNFLLNNKYKMGSYVSLPLLRLALLSAKYKIIFISQYIKNLTIYFSIKIFNNKISSNEKNIQDLKSNLYFKQRSLERFIKGVIKFIFIFLDPLNANLTHMDSNDLMKINSPFLKVSAVNEIIKKENLNKLKIICQKKGFNFKNIINHQRNRS